MIRQLDIRDFQKHERFTIQLDPKVTTIIGPSDSGKSAIVRSIRWVCTDRPLGLEFLRDGAKQVGVRLTIDDQKLIRTRSKTKSEYRINREIFKAWGSGGPPAPVADLLRISSTNFQSQHDAPFWFSLTPGEVAKACNQIVDLGAIDDVLGELNSRVRSKSAEVEITDRACQEAEQELENLALVPKLLKEWDHLETTRIALETTQEQINNLAQLTGKVRETSRQAFSLQRKAEAAGRVESLAEIVIQNSKKAERLEEIVISLQKIKAKLFPVPDIAKLEERAVCYQAIQGRSDELAILMGQAVRYEERLRTCRRETKQAEEELTLELDGKCPLCGGSISLRL